MRLLRTLVTTVLVIGLALSSARAGDYACGWDTDRDGGVDAWCPHPDHDHDGYTTNGSGLGFDCDDLDRRVRPGTYTAAGCGTDEIRRCQADGSFTTCVAASSITAPCGGDVRWVDPAGSNAPGCGTFANPCADFQCFGYYASGAPACHVGLAAGDMVIVKGSGTVSGSYDPGIGGSFRPRMLTLRASAGFSGTAGCPIVITRLPQSTAVLDPAAAVEHIYSEGGNYIHIRNLELTGGFGAAVRVSGGAQVEIEDNYVHDQIGDEDDNVAAFDLAGLADGKVRYNDARDIFDADDPPGATVQNQRLFLTWRDMGTDFGFNFGTWSEYDLPSPATRRRGACFGQKHANPTSALTVHDNVMTRCTGAAFMFAGPNTHVHHNYVFQADDAVVFTDVGGESYQQNELVDLNTFENVKTCFAPAPFKDPYVVHGGYGPIGVLTYRENVCVVASSVFNDSSRLVRVHEYGSDAICQDLQSGNKIVSNFNCYLATNLDPTTNDGAFGYCAGTPASSGASYDFPAWRATLGLDEASYMEDPQLAPGTRIATSANCASFGWIRNACARQDCKQAPATTLAIRRLPVDTVRWQWKKGDATTLAELGDPRAGTTYSLCVRDATGAILYAATADQTEFWKACGSMGFCYRDRTIPGISTVVAVRTGVAGKSKASLVAKSPGAIESLPVTVPLTVQLSASDGTCWESVFSSDDVTANTATKFNARTP